MPRKENTYLSPGPAIEKRISVHISRKKTLRLICISAPEHKGAKKQADPTNCVFLLFGDVIGIHILCHRLSSSLGVELGLGWCKRVENLQCGGENLQDRVGGAMVPDSASLPHTLRCCTHSSEQRSWGKEENTGSHCSLSPNLSTGETG